MLHNKIKATVKVSHWVPLAYRMKWKPIIKKQLMVVCILVLATNAVSRSLL